MSLNGLRILLWRPCKWFLFRLDAETAHRLTLSMIRLIRHLGRILGIGDFPLRCISGSYREYKTALPEVFGMKFLNRVGLAAGFDKDAEILTALPALGFGFVEIGTVTPKPQPGNDRPRLFRNPENESIFNRMGFNGLGATIVSNRVSEARSQLPPFFRVGINIGKNKDTPLEDAFKDYVAAAAAFEGLADYLVINVSSPNTPGLRSLQNVEALKPIVEEVSELISKWSRRPPLLLKLAPEVKKEELERILDSGVKWGINGWILTNTLAGTHQVGEKSWSGGWSGGVLKDQARASLKEAKDLLKMKDRKDVLVSVGGVLDFKEAQIRRQEGAELIQLYSGWIFRGPTFPAELARSLT